MIISRHRPMLWILGALLSAASVAGIAATDSPFLSSKTAPHGTLYLNVDQTAKQIYPVQIWQVNGKLTNRNDQGVLWVKPGDYTFTVKVARNVNLANVPGLQIRAGNGPQQHDLKMTVEPGKAYYIGAKFDAAGKWTPVIWKTEDQKD
ncbi:MAG TPA: hypothetical protein VLV87_04710 [Gammaproteobacteria bacterium]|nr:hypothetical protein [Gammaproteobacteria bacterium]